MWDPHTQDNINKVESIQRRAARFVTNNYDPRSSVTTLLQDLNWSTLQHRRQLAKLIMMYRITYHLIQIPSITYLIPSRSGTRGHNIGYLQPSTRVLAYQYSIFPNTIRLWSNLPQTLVSSGSIDIFFVIAGQTPAFHNFHFFGFNCTFLESFVNCKWEVADLTACI